MRLSQTTGTLGLYRTYDCFDVPSCAVIADNVPKGTRVIEYPKTYDLFGKQHKVQACVLPFEKDIRINLETIRIPKGCDIIDGYGFLTLDNKAKFDCYRLTKIEEY